MLKDLLSKYLGSVIRHMLTALGGGLVSLGVLRAGQDAAFVSVNSEVVIGLLVYAAGQGLSFVAKKK